MRWFYLRVSNKVHQGIREAILAFLKGYRKESRVGNKNDAKQPEGAYYWSERDAQCELFHELRKRLGSVGKKDWVHAEGYIEKTKFAKGEKSKRVDIVIMNFDTYLDWHKSWVEKDGKRERFPEYEALIEVKMLWRGLLPERDQGKIAWRWRGASNTVNTVKGIEKDLKKLSDCLSSKKTREAHLILLDSIQERGPEKGKPYFSSDAMNGLRKKRSDYLNVYLWHWPDFSRPTQSQPSKEDGLLYYHHYRPFSIFEDPTRLGKRFAPLTLPWLS